MIGLLFLLMTTASCALEGSFAYNSETSETNILPIYDSKNDNNISLILIVEILENANLSVMQAYEDTVRYNQINETGEYKYNFTVRGVWLVIESGTSHFNGTTTIPMSNQVSDIAKAEGTYMIEILETNDNFIYSESISTVILSLLGIITISKLKRRINIEK
jgi:hypothetical protein